MTAGASQGYALPAAPHWAVGIGILNYSGTAAPLRGFFVPSVRPPVMVGWAEQPQGWPAAVPVCQLCPVRLPMIGIVWRRVYNLLTGTAIMNTQLIPVFAGELSGAPAQLVDARLLHSFLEVTTRFNDWIARRIEEYEFLEGQDFYSILSKTKGRPNTDYHLSIDMAKELGMIERNEKGRQIRRYFLEMERIAQAQPIQGKLPAPKQKALPPAEDSPEVVAAIEARAMAMSLRHYEHNKAQLRDAVKRWGYGLKGQQLVELVQTIDQKDTRLFLIHRDELWKLTSSVASMTIMHRLALDNVHELEARTGTEWYGRPDNSH